MAKIFFELKQNKNQKSSIFGKWFAHSKTVETMNTRKMAQHISEHGSVYTSDVVFGVLEKFRSCLVEMQLESKRVKIDGLGIFFTTLENKKGGALKKEDFNPQKNLKALHIRFLPDSTTETNISSREFIKKAEFVNAESLADSLKEEDKPSGGGGSSQSGNTGGNTGGNTNTGGNSGSGNTGGDTTPSDSPTGDGDGN